MVSHLANEIARAVEAEEPVHAELVLDRLKQQHGVARAGRNVRANFERALTWALNRGGLRHETTAEVSDRITLVVEELIDEGGPRLGGFQITLP